MTQLTRRHLLKGSLAAGGATALTPILPHRAAAQQRMTVSVFAGVWEKAMREVYVPCFKKDVPNVEIDLLTGNETDWIAKIQANRERPPIQVMIAGIVHSLNAKRLGLLEKIDPSKIPHLKDLPAEMVYPDGYGVIVDWGREDSPSTRRWSRSRPRAGRSSSIAPRRESSAGG